MTSFADSTLPPVSKAPGKTPSLFSGLVVRLTVLCAAERDIAGLGHGDPAFDGWFRDAEAARAAVLGAAEGLLLGPCSTSHDQWLHNLCVALKALLTTSDAVRYAEAAAFLCEGAEPTWISVESNSAAAEPIGTFFSAVRFLMTLPDYALEATPCDVPMAIAA